MRTFSGGDGGRGERGETGGDFWTVAANLRQFRKKLLSQNSDQREQESMLHDWRINRVGKKLD